MRSWKKIAALFALSTSMGLLAAACSGDPQDPTDAPETAEESAAVDTPVTPDLDPLHRPTLARRACENRCLDAFRRCGRRASCDLERGRCLDRCRRF